MKEKDIDDSDVWAKAHKDARKRLLRPNNNTIGIRIFRVVKVHEPDPVNNDYKRSDPSYNKMFKKEPGATEEYKIRHLDVYLKYWSRKPYSNSLGRTNLFSIIILHSLYCIHCTILLYS